MNDIIGNIPAEIDPATAPLPARYEAACLALAECQRIDECQDWADRAAAMASYARQAADPELEAMCKRIRARAIRRCGELLREIEPARGANQNISDGVGTKVLTRKDAATEAGLSERQRVTALRVSKVPEMEFETQVESPTPPTISQLAELGTQHSSDGVRDYLEGRDPADFEAATTLVGLIALIPEEAAEIKLPAALRGLLDHERVRLAQQIEASITWLTEVLDAL